MIGATYRLQFRSGVGFSDAAAIVPHLARCGITHLYASPVFAATEGSTHGYDVTDHNVLDPTLGGAAAFDELSRALEAHGMKLLLDIVPNHMAASTENPWWRDVLKHGASSRYARHFDIDWGAPRLILPILGKPYGDALADGDLTLADHAEGGKVLRAPGHDLPLAPGTETIGDLDACHEAQSYRMAHWRLGRDGLTYRRFFEITGLVGVRVEDEAVFDDVHRLILDLVEAGKVHALRVDHVDGLADPAGYLDRLSARANVPVLVEKILEGEEVLPDWPIEGTTGYEFIAGLADLFTDREGLDALRQAYAGIACDDVEALTRSAKHQIVTQNLAGELERLTTLAMAAFATDRSARDHGRSTVREGLTALMMAMGVYRTYVAGRPSEDDKRVLAAAREGADLSTLDEPRVADDLLRLVLSDDDDPVRDEFVTRLQQTTGPLMAKAVEDTLFYRHHRLIGLNEVGGEPDPHLGEARFLKVANAGGLAATQTHDTKRGEDARARLYALSDPSAAALWQTVWPELPGAVPDVWRWALGQMLFAAEPFVEDPDLTERFREAALKTVREAKRETSWTRQDARFEAAVADAAEAMVGARDVFAPLADVRRAGALISLAQAALKVCARPAPDIYQGTFGWDFSMVDPDNRRPVDFAAEEALCRSARKAPLGELASAWQDGRIKARVLLEGLAIRRERPQLHANADVALLPTEPSADDDARIRAFLRSDGRDAVLVAVATRPLACLAPGSLTLEADRLGAACATVERPLIDRLTGRELSAGTVDLAAALAQSPVVMAASWEAPPARAD